MRSIQINCSSHSKWAWFWLHSTLAGPWQFLCRQCILQNKIFGVMNYSIYFNVTSSWVSFMGTTYIYCTIPKNPLLQDAIKHIRDTEVGKTILCRAIYIRSGDHVLCIQDSGQFVMKWYRYRRFTKLGLPQKVDTHVEHTVLQSNYGMRTSRAKRSSKT